MNPHLNDPFDLDDHRRRTPTNRDRLLAAGVREAERDRQREAGETWLAREAKREATLSLAWEAAGDEVKGQVVS